LKARLVTDWRAVGKEAEERGKSRETEAEGESTSVREGKDGSMRESLRQVRVIPGVDMM